jgi:hypothetical protein
MSCTNCNSSSTPISIQLSYSQDANCASDSSCPDISAACISFKAPNLACSGVETDDSIELAIQKIDEKLCETVGDYTSYNFHCLDDGGAITTEAEFVSAITDYVCDLSTALATFTGTTFVDYQGEVDDRFTAIEGPSLTCVSASVVSSDNLNQILSKYCTKFAAIDTALNISSVTWNSCFTVSSSPTTIAQGFDLLADQICQTKALITSSTLPTFNNSGSCLSTTGSADTLVATVNAIKTRLCQTPTLDNDNLTSSCITIPSTDTDLEGLLQNMLDKLDSLSENFPTFDSGDFSVSGSGCGGKTVALATPINQDRFVAANASDSSPSTLINKIVGVGCTVDDTTTAGKITITVSSSSVSDGKVKADSADASADYLINKVEAGASVSGVGLDVSYNATTDKIKIAPTLDPEDMLNALLTYLEENPSSSIAERLCAIIASCPSPCDGPTNVQAVAVSSDTTTTTTTSSTTTTTTTSP